MLAEFVRVIAGSTMKEAGALVAAINAPVGGLVDDLGGRKLVLANLRAPDEVLVLLDDDHPHPVPVDNIRAMRRRDGSTIRKAIRKLLARKMVEGDDSTGYQLTSKGYGQAKEVVVASQLT